MVKGDIARALFYLAVRYEGNERGSVDLELSDTPSMEIGTHGKLSVLLKWHQQDPVSDEEKHENIRSTEVTRETGIRSSINQSEWGKVSTKGW